MQRVMREQDQKQTTEYVVFLDFIGVYIERLFGSNFETSWY